MSLTLIFNNFYGDSEFLPAVWTQTNNLWRQRGFSNGATTAATFLSGGCYMRATAGALPTNQNGITPAQMGKVMLGTNWFSQLGGDATNDKVVEISCDLVWRDQTDQITVTQNSTSVTLVNHTTYVGLVFAGTLSTIGAYAVLVSRTGGATPVTTGRFVRISTGSTFANPVFTDVGGAAVTIPNASNGDRWTIKARGTWFAPSFSLASFLVSFSNASGLLGVIGMPSGQNSGTYGFNTGQGALATWGAGELYVGFVNRPGWRVANTSPAGLIGPNGYTYTTMAPNHFERLRVVDVGALANLTTSTPAYTYPAAPNLVASAVSTESNPSAYTLPVQPSWTQETNDQWAVSTFYSDSGDRVAFPNQTRRRRRWSLKWTALDGSEKAALETLTADVKGRFNTWTWTEPETNLAVSVRFVSDMEFQKIGPSVWAAAATAEEVLT